MKRAILLGLAVSLLALAGGVAYALPRWLDWDRHRETIAQIASERLGRPVALGGRVALVLLPQPRLEATRIVIGQTADEIQMSARALRLRLDLLALLRGRVEVRELALIGTDIHLPWPPTALPGLAPPPWLTALDARLEDSRIHLGGVVLEGVNARLTAGNVGESLTAEGSLAWRGRPMRFHAVLGRGGDSGVAPLDITAGHAGANLRARGVLLTEGGFAGRLEASGPDLAALIPAPSGNFHATANLAAGAHVLVANQLELTLGGDAVRGGAVLRLLPEPRFELTLTAPRLDLEPWLTAIRAAGTQAIPVAFDLSAEEARFGPLALDRLRATAVLQDGRLTIGRLTARMPGDTALELSGGGSGARLDLGLRWSSSNAAAWASAVGLLPEGFLPPNASSGQLRLVWEGADFAVSDLTARLGSSAATGGFVWRQGARPSLALGLELDVLELPSPAGQMLAALRDAGNEADLQLRVGIGRLILANALWEQVAVDAAAEGGRLLLRRFAGRHLGLDVVLAGTLVGGRISELSVEAEGRAAGLLQHLGVARPAIAGTPLRLRATGAGTLDALALRVESDFAEARLEAQATLDLPQQRLQARLTARHPGAARLLGEAFGISHPDWIGEGSFSLIASLSVRSRAWTADSLEVVAGELRGRGQLAVTATADRPVVSGRIALERLVLPHPSVLAGTNWPSLDVDLTLTADRLLPQGLEAFSARLQGNATHLRLDDVRASLAGGTIGGQARLERGVHPRVAVEGQFADIVLAGPLTGRPVDIAAGRLSGRVTLEATGGSPEAWAGTVKGDGELALRDGVVQGFNAPAAAAAMESADGRSTQQALREAFATGATPVERGVARFTLERGQLHLLEASLGVEGGLLVGVSGKVDFIRDELSLRVTLPTTQDAPEVAWRLTGPSLRPALTPQIGAWLQWRTENPP